MALTSLSDYLRRPSVASVAQGGRVPLRDYLRGARAAPARSGAVAQGTSPAPAQPSAPLIPREVGMGVGLARSLAPLFRQPGLTTGAQTVSDLFNVFGGAEALSRAQTPAATAGGALRTVSGLSGLGRNLDVPGAGAVSAATGLGSAGLNLARGNIPGGVQNLITGAGTVANLFPASATLAGVPVSAAGGAATGGLAAAEAGIGLGGGAPLAGASLAGAAGALAIPFVVGKGVETIVNAILGEGMFGPTKLPFGRGNQFSSADNLASQVSKFASIRGENQVRQAIQQATDPTELLALAIGGLGLSAHGEIQFTHPEFGFGGDWDDPQAETYAAVVQQIARTGDPDLLRRFIGGIQIQTGETGMPAPNYLLTDWYRRKLVSLLPETHPLRQDLTGLFEPTPAAFAPEGRAGSYLTDLAQLNEQYRPAGGPQYTAEDAIRGLMGGNVGQQTIAQLFRPPAELIDRATAERLVAASPAFAPPVPTPIYPRDTAPVRPWYESNFPSLQSGGYVSAPSGAPVPATIHGGEYVVPAGPTAEMLRRLFGAAPRSATVRAPGKRLDEPFRWFLSPRRGLYQGSLMLDPANDWSVVALPSEEEDDPEPATLERLRAQGERPIVVPDDLYGRLGQGLEPEVERFRVEQYERKHGELWEFPEPIRPRPALTPDEEDEIGAHRAAAGRGARLIPLRDYFMARATGQGNFNGAPWPEALRPGPPTPEEMRRRERTPPMRELPGSRPMTPEERRQIQWPPSVVQLI